MFEEKSLASKIPGIPEAAPSSRTEEVDCWEEGRNEATSRMWFARNKEAIHIDDACNAQFEGDVFGATNVRPEGLWMKVLPVNAIGVWE